MDRLRREPPDVDEFTSDVKALVIALTTVGRLEALAAIGEPELAKKRATVRRAMTVLDAADALCGGLNEFARDRSQLTVAWPAYVPLERNGVTDPEPTLDEIHSLRAHIAAAASDLAESLLERASDTPLLDRTSMKLEYAARALPEHVGQESTELKLREHGLTWKSRTNRSDLQIVRRLRGPRQSELNPEVERSTSWIDASPDEYGDDIRRAVPYMWYLAIREAMASDLCSLCLAEYDGLPLPFYLEAAKQSLDEAGHAEYFLLGAIEMLGELEDALDEDDPLMPYLAKFRRSGRGLPVPLEGNLYESIWAADLGERLVLLHHDTEAPAVKKLKRRLRGEFCKSHPLLERSFKITRYDEISHASIGARWLRVLYPTTKERKQALEHARRMRGMLVLSSFAQQGGRSLGELLEHFSQHPLEEHVPVPA
ncbi:MAG: hypothetical protein ABR992_04080 [Solirubrobacteraceae bacterium]|jgi:hypothetical protein